MIVTITGRSGSGKSTLERELTSMHMGRMFASYTTRNPRRSDRPGEYRYMSGETFRRLDEAGEFITTVAFLRHSYGFLLREFREVHCALTPCFRPVTPDTLIPLYRRSNGNLLNIHISAHDEDLIRRLSGRDGNPEDMRNRLHEEADVEETVFDLANGGIPTIFIPLSNSPHDQIPRIMDAIRRLY